MSLKATIFISKECADADQAHDWIDEVKELLKGNVEGRFQSNETNHNPTEELME